jgi:hypothetical protein
MVLAECSDVDLCLARPTLGQVLFAALVGQHAVTGTADDLRTLKCRVEVLRSLGQKMEFNVGRSVQHRRVGTIQSLLSTNKLACAHYKCG